MHSLTLTQPVNVGPTFGTLTPGLWIMHDLNAFEIAQMAPRGSATVDSFGGIDSLFSGNPDPDKPLLVMRSGAIGDLLMLTPALAALKREMGSRKLVLCTADTPAQTELFVGNKDVDELVRYPLEARLLENYSAVISLENTMESDHSRHASDVFAKALGVSIPLSDYRPRYVVLDAEKEQVKEHLFTGRPNVAIHMRASVANRNYPAPYWLEVIGRLEKSGWGILLLDSRGKIPPLPPHLNSPFIRNLSEKDLTFRQSAAILAQCDAFAGIDSAWIHMCHALDVPAVGLYGPFKWETRTAHAPKTFAISGNGDCAGCSWHMHAGRMFPPGKPCSTARHCVVLASIEPRRIVERVNLLKP